MLLTLGAFGGVAYFALQKPAELYWAFLVAPAVCFVLGWQYVVYDHKVSQLGEYVREVLGPRIAARVGAGAEGVFGWEGYHRTDPGRATRKTVQPLVDVVAFILPGFAAVGLYAVWAWRREGPAATVGLGLVATGLVSVPWWALRAFSDNTVPKPTAAPSAGPGAG